MDNPRQIVSQLGTVKNPVLLTSTSFSTVMLYYSHDLLTSSVLLAAVIGAIVYLSSVAVFLFGIAFYVYAFLRLPSSTQEAVFLQEAKGAIDHHRKASKRPRLKNNKAEADEG
ncbi:hypothetical protein [Acidisphaera sp. S103]|uniref:hypothetical protein n=1 Tax=Acidisphaera sp. S103 TaxID=1747223 RepID=UPI00131AC9C6|nr:hypothetical protein [Acidisphaera sp. S103]